MAAFMVKITQTADSVQYKAIVAKDEAHARQYARSSEPAAQSVEIVKELGSSESRFLGLEDKPEGHVEPWAPST